MIKIASNECTKLGRLNVVVGHWWCFVNDFVVIVIKVSRGVNPLGRKLFDLNFK